MQLMALLMPLISLVSFVAFVWLVVVAFKHSTMWGVLVLLFSPITAIVFAIKCWEDAKKPFLTYMGSTAAGVVVLVVFFVYLSAPMVEMAQQMQEGEVSSAEAADFFEEHMDRMENTGMLDSADKRELDKMRGMLQEMRDEAEPEQRTGDSPGSALTAALARADSMGRPESPSTAAADTAVYDAAAVSTTRIKRSGDDVSLRDIDDHIGDRMKVVTGDGAELTGTYMGRDGDDLQFARRLSSGTIDVWVDRDDVRSLTLIKGRKR